MLIAMCRVCLNTFHPQVKTNSKMKGFDWSATANDQCDIIEASCYVFLLRNQTKHGFSLATVSKKSAMVFKPVSKSHLQVTLSTRVTRFWCARETLKIDIRSYRCVSLSWPLVRSSRANERVRMDKLLLSHSCHTA